MNYYDNHGQDGFDLYRNTMCKEARGIFSRFLLALFAYLLVSEFSVTAISIVLSLFLDESAFNSIYLQYALGFLPMYVLGLPILYLIVRKMPKKTLETSSVGVGEMLAYIAVAQALMTIGNLIGVSLNTFIGIFVGGEIDNSTATLINDSPIWLIILAVVIVGPIIEELIFRKLMIDRLSVCGNVIAITVSAIAFGLFHGNLYQFFYAAFLGFLLGYVYVKSGKIIYSIIIHMTVNLLGSVVVIPILDLMEKVEIMTEALANGEVIDMISYTLSSMAITSYSLINYAIIITGAIILVNAIRKKQIKVKSDALINIPQSDTLRVAFLNTGAILFTVYCLLSFFVSIIASV